MIYCYTVILNGFDNVRPPAAGATHDLARFICYTNIPNLPRVTPWEYRPLVDDGGRASRKPKILAHLVLPSDTKYSIYHDGNFQLKFDPLHTVEKLLDDKRQWAVHRHPCRSCVYEEADVVLRDCPLTDKESVRRQVADYRQRGLPGNAGLWANGFIVRRHTPEVERLNELWWTEFKNGSDRDQLSFPMALREAGMEIKTIDADIYSSPWAGHAPHAWEKFKKDNPDYWAERADIRRKLARLDELTGSSLVARYGMTKQADGITPFQF